jgi:hypothetical protein
MIERRSKPRRTGDAMDNKQIMRTLTDFIDRYEKDMRGDMNLGNGEKGIVNEIRGIKDKLKEYPTSDEMKGLIKYTSDYPTIAFQFKKSPVKVVGAVIGIFMVLMMLYTVGMLEVFAKLFGISLK